MRILSKLTSHPVFYCILFMAVVALLYGRVIFFDVVYFDDHLWVKTFHDYLVRGIRWWEFFGRTDMVTDLYYRPILNLSFAIDARAGGGSPIAYHITNLALHTVNVFLVFGILQAWGFSRARALFGALVFLSHPALVQAIAWIPGRTDSLLGLFCFAGLLMYLKFIQQQYWFYLIGYVLCLAGALLTKETGIALALMVVLRDVSHSWGKGSRLKGWWKIPAVTGGVVFFWALVRLQVVAAATPRSLEEKIISFLDNLPAVWLYLGKVFLPFNLSVFPMLIEGTVMYGIISLLFLSGWAIAVKSRNVRNVLWAALWFAVFLLPSLVLSDLEYEYRLYVPMLGALIVVLELIPNNWNRYAAFGLSSVLIVILAGMSWRYTDSFRDQWVFWTRAAKEAPRSALAQKNLGSMYYFKREYDKAEEYYLKALAINPFEQMVNNNLGLIYQTRGNPQKAVEYYRQEILHYPDYELPYLNWGLLLIQQDRLSEAAGFMEKALERNPLLQDPYDYLMQIYLKHGQIDKAKATARRLKSIGAEIPPHVLERARRLNINLLD